MILMGKRGRAIGLTVIATTTAIVSCAAIFGLDPPTRAPDDASTPEAALDATTGHADGDADAADGSDGDSGPIVIRCGFPDAQIFCPGGGSSPDAGVCCAEGPMTYACKTKDTCQGFAIECDYDTCPAPRLCCKYMLHTTCQRADEKCSTGTTAQVCDPNDGGIGCPSGSSCGNVVMISGAPSPYHTCN